IRRGGGGGKRGEFRGRRFFKKKKTETRERAQPRSRNAAIAVASVNQGPRTVRGTACQWEAGPFSSCFSSVLGFFSSRRRHTRFKCDWRFRRVLFRSDVTLSTISGNTGVEVGGVNVQSSSGL